MERKSWRANGTIPSGRAKGEESSGTAAGFLYQSPKMKKEMKMTPRMPRMKSATLDQDQSGKGQMFQTRVFLIAVAAGSGSDHSER
jgi:hypothetical protein